MAAALMRCSPRWPGTYRFRRAASANGAEFRHAGLVLYLPPYCWDLTPLDNGVFGQLKLWLQGENNQWAKRKGLDFAIDYALYNIFGRGGGGAARRVARSCFRRCYGDAFC